MLGAGEKFPSYSLTAAVGTGEEEKDAFRTITDLDYAGKWKVYFFWPKDFMAACPGEVVEFAKLDKEFQEHEAQILGVSIDSEWAHHVWRNSNPELKAVPFPMLSDIKRELCAQLGILNPNDGVPHRATFVVNPEGVIQFVCIATKLVGRNAQEILRVLQALQSEDGGAKDRHEPEAQRKVA